MSRRIVVLGCVCGAAVLLTGAHLSGQPAATAAAKPAYAEPSIAPDGSEVAFVSGGDIWSVPSAGGTARLLVSSAADDRRPVYSPDQRQLAFVSTRTGGGDIYVLTLAAGTLQRLTWDDGPDQLDGWSRDGKWIYFFTSGRDISGMDDVFRVAATGGTPMKVSGDRYASEYFSAPSPDGRTLAISARGIASSQWWRNGHSHLDEAEIWLRDLTVGDTPSAWRALTHGGAKDMWPMWDGDGRSLYFVSDRTGAENIWRIDAQPGAAARQVTRFTSGRVLWPSISARGDAIVFERDFGIWKADPSTGRAAEIPIAREGAPAGPGSEHLRLTNRFSDLALSPDGRKIAFAARGEIFAASAKDGGDAARVTNTPADESSPAWAPDSRRIVYVSDRDGDSHLFLYDFARSTETKLTAASGSDNAPAFSPDGKSIAFVRDGHELHVVQADGQQDRLLAKGYIADAIAGGRPIAWSPDGRWIAYFVTAGRGFVNVHVVPAAGGDERPVTFLANGNATGVAWAPDGTFLVFDSGQRTEPGQLVRVDLVLRTPTFREDRFRDLFHEENAPSRPPETPEAPEKKSPEADRGPHAHPVKPVKIVFDDIRRRLSVLPTGLDAGEPFLSPDGKTIVLIAGAGGQQNLYSWSLDELARERPVARQLTSTPGGKADVSFTPDGKEIYYLDAGRVHALALDKREPRTVDVTAEMDVEFKTEKLEIFGEAWRRLRDYFVDPHFNGLDWNAERQRYEPYVAGARTMDEVRRIASLMIGDLNSSHSGIAAPPSGGDGEGVGHLGLTFDRAEYESSGRFRITGVLPLGPGALPQAVAVGDYLTAIDGEALGATTNIDRLLDHTVGRRVVLKIARDATGRDAKEVAVRPVSQRAEKQLRYEQWVAERRAYVDRISGGKLGYVHMPDMSAASLAQLYLDLDADNMSKEGVVIDIRNNNGGFVNVYAIDVLARRPYLNMTLRGTPTTAARSLLGQRALERPTVLVTNQHSLSDAEDFTEGYRALGLGKVVGEPTAGWIIYTWNTRLMDGTSLRLPRTRITDRNGAPMEMHPRPVDVEVKRPIGESYGSTDSQLDKAVQVLLAQIASKSQRPKP
ncbi:MAG TPA: S41 family peptidase [Vicinamibacterales bacterium]|nr:S41 family peptidase [Vicinamibacterales bacterium]